MKASETYRHPDYMHNCSQALAFKFAQLYPDPQIIMQRFAATGGGRAPQGMCGALYAAVEAFPQLRQQVVEQFVAHTQGHSTCHDIKMKAGVSCKQCIDIAEEIMERLASK